MSILSTLHWEAKPSLHHKFVLPLSLCSSPLCCPTYPTASRQQGIVMGPHVTHLWPSLGIQTLRRALTLSCVSTWSSLTFPTQFLILTISLVPWKGTLIPFFTLSLCFPPSSRNIFFFYFYLVSSDLQTFPYLLKIHIIRSCLWNSKCHKKWKMT